MAGTAGRWRAGRRARRTRTDASAGSSTASLDRVAGLAWIEQAVRPHPAPQRDPRHAEHLGGALAVAGGALEGDADPARLRTRVAGAGLRPRAGGADRRG